MLRVCGLTFDHTTNYGSCLQAYALSRVINTTVINEEACDYELIPLSACKGFPKAEGTKSLIRTLYRFVSKIKYRIDRVSFEEFEKKYMKYCDCKHLSELEALNEKFDAFVCGGDVIWCPDYNFGLPLYFLGFAHKYSFSYAASFRTAEAAQEVLEDKREYLQKLDQIGLREKSAAAILKKALDNPVRIVADPVLLLKRDEWDLIIGRQKKVNN